MTLVYRVRSSTAGCSLSRSPTPCAQSTSVWLLFSVWGVTYAVSCPASPFAVKYIALVALSRRYCTDAGAARSPVVAQTDHPGGTKNTWSVEVPGGSPGTDAG